MNLLSFYFSPFWNLPLAPFTPDISVETADPG